MNQKLRSLGTRNLISCFPVLIFVLLLLPQTANAKPDISKLERQELVIDARQINFDPENPDRIRFGKLKWLGGISLSAPSAFFGGYSGLAITSDGKRLISVSDSGSWLVSEISYNGTRIDKLRNSIIGPLLDSAGRSLTGKGDNDAEAIELYDLSGAKGAAIVSFERNHRIGRFKTSDKGIGKQSGSIRLTKSMKRLSANRGLEAMTLLRTGKHKGNLVIFAERDKTAKGDLRGWLYRKSKFKPIILKRLKGYDLTGLASMPDGGFLVLERRFRFSEGVKMRIRRVYPKEIKPGKIIKGETLLEAHGNFNIDNMEGIATHQNKKGETVITLISDDNFNLLQRTLLLQFALPETQRPAAR